MIQKKVCMLGMLGVGKTNLVSRFVRQMFGEKYHSTVGVKVDHKLVKLEQQEVNMLLWDIQDQEAQTPSMENYFRGAHGALVVHDLTRPESARALQEYCERFLRVAPNAKLIFVGNKNDLVESSKLDPAVFAPMLGQKSAVQFFTSAKTGDNVDQTFITLAQMLMA